VLQGQVDEKKKSIFLVRSKFKARIGRAKQAMAFYAAQIKATRDAMRAWTQVAIKFNVVKDVRKLIAKLIWDSREEAAAQNDARALCFAWLLSERSEEQLLRRAAESFSLAQVWMAALSRGKDRFEWASKAASNPKDSCPWWLGVCYRDACGCERDMAKVCCLVCIWFVFGLFGLFGLVGLVCLWFLFGYVWFVCFVCFLFDLVCLFVFQNFQAEQCFLSGARLGDVDSMGKFG
jgi:hypothetical protein